jgi:adenylate kinase
MDWAHLSLGDAFRDEIAQGSPLGVQLRQYVADGVLVPDALAVEVAARLLDRHAGHAGVFLDGFPRTVGQAEVFATASPAAVRLCLVLVVTNRELSARLAARGRHDDHPSMIRQRLLSYRRDTAPVISHYAQQGLIRYVDANGSPAEVTAKLHALLRDAEIVTS